MKTKQKLLDDNILIGMGVFMYVSNEDKMLKITDQMREEGRKIDNQLVVAIGDKFYSCKYSKAKEQIKVDYKGGSVSIKSSWNPGDENFSGEIDGKKIANLEIIKEDRIGNYVIKSKDSEISIAVRSPEVFELEKMITKIKASLPKEKPIVKEKPTQVAGGQAGVSLDEQIAVAIVAIKANQ